MTEDEFRKQMKEYGWDDKVIENDIKLCRMLHAEGYYEVTLEDRLTPYKRAVTGHPSFVSIDEVQK